MPMDWEKWQQKRESQPLPPDLNQIFDKFKGIRGRLPGLFVLLGLLLVAWLLSGIFIVSPDEVGIVKRFGALSRTADPGPHYHLPYPIESVVKPKVTQVRRFEIGFRTTNPGPPPQYRPVTDEALMLTGDENIIDIQFIVQYRIKSPTDFLFNVLDPNKTIQDAAEAAMREVIGKNNIDEALTGGKFQIQKDAEKTLREILDRYHAGLEVITVQLQAVQPPQQVIEAFKDVASAREDQNRFINEAEGYVNDILPKAKGQAAQIERQAEGYKLEKIKRAEGDASRFLAQVKEYQLNKDVTRKRLYLETMEEVLGRAQKFVLDGQRSGVLPLLPLNDLLRQPTAPEKKGGN